MSHPQSDAVRWLTRQMLAAGVDWLVVCPGSRSTPLVQAAVEIEEAGHWRLEVVLDERQAGFAALGLARAGRRPAVVTTSGSAVAHLLPACVEAGETGTPLLLLTADRPARLRNRGAPQTVRQPALLTSYAQVVDLELSHGLSETDRAGTLEALARWATGGLLHLNACVDTPLALQAASESDLGSGSGGGGSGGGGSGGGGAGGGTLLEAPFAPEQLPASLHDGSVLPPLQDALAPPAAGEKVLLIAGSLPVDPALAALVPALCARAVVLAEWTSQLAAAAEEAGAPRTFDALLREPVLLAQLRPDRIVRLGEWPASKGLQTLLEQADSLGIAVQGVWGPRRSDPLDQVAVASTLPPAVALAAWQRSPEPSTAAWRSAWQAADTAARGAAAQLPAQGWELAAVAAVNASLTAETLLVVGNSMPVRDMDALNLQPRPCARALCSRGANGIDGTLAMAWGAALGSAAPTRVYLGDSTFLHDVGALQLLARQPTGLDLRVLVIDNDGGAIFDYLPARAAMAQAVHERFFTAPHGLDLVSIARGFGLQAQRVDTQEELLSAWLAPGGGVRIVVLAADRSRSVQLHRQWQHSQIAAAVAALEQGAPC